MQKAKPQGMPVVARVFIAAVGVAGLAGMVITFAGWQPELRSRFVFYLLIALASSGMKVRFPGTKSSISANDVFTMLGLLELRLPETLILATAGAIAQLCWHAKGRVKMVGLFFNSTSVALAVFSAAWMFGRPWFTNMPEGELLRLALAGVVYFVVNTVPVSVVIALHEHRSVQTVWKENYYWLFFYYMVGVSLAEVVHTATQRIGFAFTLALLPLAYAIYRSYKLYLGKLEQEKVHAESMASLHLKTIEALAMAIEAKDECTHEHLRRVQVYSLELGKYLGLPPDQVHALQAASILHDIGKLAVPDYIISKPGKLTPEEFDKMKIHTIVGAEILEQVGFPYPVSPIVRSHHEKWDGTGYPDGLKDEEIPIGARILSAVDCLDALASDRQYRRALPLDDAMNYVASLSGRSFDPKVVEVLKHHYRDFERLAQSTPLQSTRLRKDIVVSRGDAPDAGFEKSPGAAVESTEELVKAHAASVASARREMQTVLELAQDVSGSLRPQELLSVLAERLRHIVPYDCIAVYSRDGEVLRPKYVNGENSRTFAALEIPVGQGLSGWVVENGKPIINGNPSVEPGYLKDPSRFSVLNSALSIPLRDEAGQVNGALTLYGAEKDAYSRDQLRVLLAVADKVARAIEISIKAGPPQHSTRDELTGLPNADSLYSHLQKELGRCELEGKTLAILACDLSGVKQVNARYGHLNGDALLRRVAEILQSKCRSSDFVARMGGDEFAVVLNGMRASELAGRVESLDSMVRAASLEMFGDESVGMSVGVACFPEHGADVDSLLSHADQEMERSKREQKAGNGVLELARSLK
ncbi:MAG: diguanylate cyclase [Acidobacteriia bacterium]|nr:diguanylate cyclase [Terriglobia bacterium]